MNLSKHNQNSFRKTSVFLFISFMISSLSFAGVTGKLAGHITDLNTGDPLIGTNIIIQGTNIGAASDADGNFVILNIPPGTYAVLASMVGYADVIVQDVRIEIDRTTTIDFELRIEAIEGESVTVQAERKLVKVDVAASQRTVTNEEIESMPFTSIGEVLSIQAGVQGGFQIRGGSANETMFMVDGIAMRDERDNNPITQIPLSAVDELSIQTGGFNAEYHNVRSGLVNVVTKDGNPDFYSATISFKRSPPAPKHFGISVYDENSYWLRPYMDDDVAWTGTDNGAWDIYTQRQYPSFKGWNAVSAATLNDDDPTNDLTPAGAKRLYEWEHRKQGNITKTDYNIDAGFGGPVPLVSKALGNLRFYSSYRREVNRYLIPLSRDGVTDKSLMLKLTSDISNATKLTILSFYGETYATAFSRSGGTSYMDDVWDVASTIDRRGHTIRWRIFGENYWSQTARYFNTLSAKLTRVVDPDTYYEIVLKQVGKIYRTGPMRDRDPEKKYEIFPGYFVDEAPFGFEPGASWGIDGMGMGGSVSTSRDSTEVKTITASFDYISQINYNHEVKTGLEFTYNIFDMQFGMVNKLLPEGNTWTEFTRKPFMTTAYFQDKLEYEGFIATLGLNLDYTDPNGEWYDIEDYERKFFSSAYDPEKSDIPMKKAKPQLTISPRLAISHPITINSKLYFNYGHYRQMPASEVIYRVQRNISGGIDRIGDPALILEKTVSYELGYDQALADNTYLLHLSTYYRDIADQQDWTRYISFDSKVNYRRTTSNSYEDIRGFELEFSKLSGRWLTGNINYEYRVSTSGFFGVRENYENPSEQRDYERQNPQQYKPLPTPRLKTYIDFHTPAKFGPAVFGQHLLGRWYMNFIGRWTSGSWFTWNPNRVAGVLYNVRWKDYYNVDFKMSKVFVLGNAQIKVFLDVFNLFNLKYFSREGYYDAHDYNYYMYSLHLPEKVVDKLGDYPNIPGSDRPGDVRAENVDFVPIEWSADVNNMTVPNSGVIYYDAGTESYLEYEDGSWSEVENSRMDKVLEEKAYIDMPNQSYFTFLNPRDIFFGINVSFNLR